MKQPTPRTSRPDLIGKFSDLAGGTIIEWTDKYYVCQMPDGRKVIFSHNGPGEDLRLP